MFTGLIKEVGRIISFTPNTEGAALIIAAPKLVPSIDIDDSVAVDGVCLTATEINPENGQFKVQAVTTTLEKTTLKNLQTNQKVNLELAVGLSERLGGHLVQGHVNGVTTLKNITPQGDSTRLTFHLDDLLSRYLIQEGSVAINGVSLTIATLSESDFSVALIPHTLQNTNLHSLEIGSEVNIEVDVIAKYVERLLQFNHNTVHKNSLLNRWSESFGESNL